MNLDIILPMTLYWRGFRKTLPQLLEILSYTDKELDNYLALHMPKISKDWRSVGIKELEWCEKNNVQVISIFDVDYISQLKALEVAPWLLCVWGNKKMLDANGLTVVGGRQMSLSAAKWIDTELSHFIKSNQLSIISGGARGVDQQAHRVAIREGQCTWAHLPSGIAYIYPANLNSIKEDLLMTGGGLISAYGPFEKMRKHHFIERNYNMALHANYTLIIEARRRSGTLITAKAALDFGRGLGVVPSGPFDIGLGGLDLIKDGADIIVNTADLKNAVFNSLIPCANGTSQRPRIEG